MNRIFSVVVFVLSSVIAVSAWAAQPLSGNVYVLDPGHGGIDPGAHGVFNGTEVYEAPYMQDVALRLAKRIRDLGGLVVFTRHEKAQKDQKPTDAPPSKVLALAGTKDVFTFDGKIVRAQPVGMRSRLGVVREVLKKHPKQKVVFISLHFDSATDAAFEGVHFVAPKGTEIDDRSTGPKILWLLEDEFRKAKRLRKKDGVEHYPITVSGDKSHGIRPLYVLSPRTNHVRERVLIELGNFKNRTDVWRLRNPTTRETYATIIASALVRLAAPKTESAKR